MSSGTGKNSSRALRIDHAWANSRSRWIAMLVAAVSLALCLVGGAIIISVLSGQPTTVDEALYRAISGFRAPWLKGPSLVLNQVGGGKVA
ncbi:MAG: hypothetical protein H7279_11320, partial [Microbacteriaceae bacterium]|nr:hypothetical protein [Microbacteriaceae bacterium]